MGLEETDYLVVLDTLDKKVRFHNTTQIHKQFRIIIFRIIKLQLSDTLINIVSHTVTCGFSSLGERGSPGLPGLPGVPFPSGLLEKGEYGIPGNSGLPGFPGPRGNTTFCLLYLRINDLAFKRC